MGKTKKQPGNGTHRGNPQCWEMAPRSTEGTVQAKMCGQYLLEGDANWLFTRDSEYPGFHNNWGELAHMYALSTDHLYAA